MFCLEQLAEQLDLVLQEVSWPARQTLTQDATEAPQKAAAGTEASGADHSAPAGEDGFVFGVTLEQIDKLNLLISAITAYGDAVSADGMADFADGTLAMLGHAIFDGANEVGDILVQVGAQQMGKGARLRFSVEETPPAYGVETPFETGHAARTAVATAYQPLAGNPPPGGLRLH